MIEFKIFCIKCRKEFIKHQESHNINFSSEIPYCEIDNCMFNHVCKK
jgi:hypothetical protein